MEIAITKKMVDITFDFIEGRRVKKESDSVVLRGVRGAKFPASLLRSQDEESPLSCYMDGEKQAAIAEKYGMPSGVPVVFGRLGRRYARQVELYWTYTAVMEFIQPVTQKPIETAFPSGGEYDALLVRCYKRGITTIGHFLDFFVRYEVTTIRNRLLKITGEAFDVIFANIRAACYELL